MDTQLVSTRIGMRIRTGLSMPHSLWCPLEACVECHLVDPLPLILPLHMLTITCDQELPKATSADSFMHHGQGPGGVG